MEPLHIIKQYIQEGEHLQQDFKFEISDVCKIARSVSAFANTVGGRLLVGVKDNGKIAGVRSEEEMYMIQAAANVYCTPVVQCQMSTHTVEGKTVLVAEILESTQKPVFVIQAEQKRQAYIRIDDENILATAVHLQLWNEEKSPKGELLPYTDKERDLLQLLQDQQGITLNRLCSKTVFSRRKLIRLLAQLIRYDVVEMLFLERKFVFRAKL